MNCNFCACIVVCLSVYSSGFPTSVENMGTGNLQNLVGGVSLSQYMGGAWWAPYLVNTCTGMCRLKNLILLLS